MRGPAWILGVVLLSGVSLAQGALEDAPGLASAIAGRVCDDRDDDGRCGPGEPGLAGVRLVLATGREVLTDAQGRYHLTGLDARTPEATGGVHLRPGRHRLRVDSRTLPPGGKVRPEAVTVEVTWGAVGPPGLRGPHAHGRAAAPGARARGGPASGGDPPGGHSSSSSPARPRREIGCAWRRPTRR